MNENAGNNDTVTGKAVGTAMGIGVGVALTGLGALAVGKVSKDLASNAGSLLKGAGSLAKTSGKAVKDTATNVAHTVGSANKKAFKKGKETILETVEAADSLKRGVGERLYNTPKDF